MEQDERTTRISRSDLLEIVASANAASARDLASQLRRLKARIVSLQAELRDYRGESAPSDPLEEDALPFETVTEKVFGLTPTQSEIAALIREIDRLKAENTDLSRRLKALEDHNRELTVAATERARRVQEREAELTQAVARIAALLPDNDRLRRQHAAMAERVAAVEAHNQLLTEAATERARKVQEGEAELTEARIEIATLSKDNDFLRVGNAIIAQRAAEFEEHNQLLTESATETARKLQQRDAELTRALTEIATIMPANERLRAEHAVIFQHAAELEAHNQLLTESATDTARKLQRRDAELTQALIEVATLSSANERLRAELADALKRAARPPGRGGKT